MQKIELRTYQVEQIQTICREFGNDAKELINILHKVQNQFGFLPSEVQEVIANELNIPVSRIFGVISFYSFFTMQPKGQYPISVCLGTACYVRGSEAILAEFKKNLGIEVGEVTPDGIFSINCLRCVGACGLAPVVMVGEKTYGRMSPEMVKSIIDEYRTKQQ
jgi:NADH-quinone oxidoreductase subunit E/NADP-reducing hydrogenase subunit HndA